MNYKERNREIKYLRFSKGYILNLIGMMYDVSGERIRQICGQGYGGQKKSPKKDLTTRNEADMITCMRQKRKIQAVLWTRPVPAGKVSRLASVSTSRPLGRYQSLPGGFLKDLTTRNEVERI